MGKLELVTFSEDEGISVSEDTLESVFFSVGERPFVVLGVIGAGSASHETESVLESVRRNTSSLKEFDTSEGSSMSIWIEHLGKCTGNPQNDAAEILLLHCDVSSLKGNLEMKAKVWTMLVMLSSQVFFVLPADDSSVYTNPEFVWLQEKLRFNLQAKDIKELIENNFLPCVTLIVTNPHVPERENENDEIMTADKRLFRSQTLFHFGTAKAMQIMKPLDSKSPSLIQVLNQISPKDFGKKVGGIEDVISVDSNKWKLLLNHFSQVLNNGGRFSLSGIGNTLIIAIAVEAFKESMHVMETQFYSNEGEFLGERKEEEEEFLEISSFAKDASGLNHANFIASAAGEEQRTSKIPFFVMKVQREQLKTVLNFLRQFVRPDSGIDAYMLEALEEVFFASQCVSLHRFSEISQKTMRSIGENLFSDSILRNGVDYEEGIDQANLSASVSATFATFDFFLRDFQGRYGYLGCFGENACLNTIYRNMRELLEEPIKSAESFYMKKLSNEKDRRRRAEKALARTQRDLDFLNGTLEREGGEDSLVIMAKLESELKEAHQQNQQLKYKLGLAEEQGMKAVQSLADCERRLHLKAKLKRYKDLATEADEKEKETFQDAEEERKNNVSGGTKAEKIISNFYLENEGQLNTGEFWSWLDPNDGEEEMYKKFDERRKEIKQKIEKETKEEDHIHELNSRLEDLLARLQLREAEAQEWKKKYSSLKQEWKTAQRNNTISDIFIKKPRGKGSEKLQDDNEEGFEEESIIKGLQVELGEGQKSRHELQRQLKQLQYDYSELRNQLNRKKSEMLTFQQVESATEHSKIKTPTFTLLQLFCACGVCCFLMMFSFHNALMRAGSLK